MTEATSGDNLPEIKTQWNHDDPAQSERRFRQALLDTTGVADHSYTLQLKTQPARSMGLQDKFAEAAFDKLLQVTWFVQESPQRLERLAGIASGTILK